MKNWFIERWPIIIFVVVALVLFSGFPIDYYKGNERIQIMKQKYNEQ